MSKKSQLPIAVVAGQHIGAMMLPLLRALPALSCALLLVSLSPEANAQSDAKPADKPAAAPAGDPAKDGQRRSDDFAEASRVLGGPAGNPECVWLGRRVVALLWRDDLDTAFRHLDLYDRFGCPGPHIQATFRCVVRQGSIDPKAPESVSARVHACWLSPANSSTASAAPATSAAPAAGTSGK